MSEPTYDTDARADTDEPLEGAPGDGDEFGGIGLETPDADAVEQHTPARDYREAGARARSYERRFAIKEVDAADAADQERTVEFDEDEYR